MEVHNTFKTQKNFCLGGDDIFVLSQLYLPLIGIDSFSLYFVLNTLDDKEQYQIKKLLDNLNISNSSHLKKAMEKLEGVALMACFYNETKDTYIFQMQRPLLTEFFFENTLLSSFLQSQIGSVEYEKTVVMKRKNKNSGYKDISSSFDEVFKMTGLDLDKALPKAFLNKNKYDITIKNANFDYALFKLSFDTSFFEATIFDDEEFKSEILKISYNFNLNEEEMKEALMRTIEIDKDLKYKDIAKNARAIYSLKNKNKPAKFVTKTPDPYIASDQNEDTVEIIEMLQRMSLASMLESIGGMKATNSELEMFENLQRTTGLPQEVINVMILYIEKEKQGVIPGASYFEKVAATWKRAGVNSAKAALDYINKPVQKKYGKRVKENPEWLEKYVDEHKNVVQVELTDEETEKALAELKEKFKGKSK
ncbi:MAG TPA: DnaD domain protein [Bacilli bacterium]|nr:DnaD domain protein [Bacilli bacterium]